MKLGYWCGCKGWLRDVYGSVGVGPWCPDGDYSCHQKISFAIWGLCRRNFYVFLLNKRRVIILSSPTSPVPVGSNISQKHLTIVGPSFCINFWSRWASLSFNFLGILIFFNGDGKGMRCVPLKRIGLHSSGTLGCITPRKVDMAQYGQMNSLPQVTRTRDGQLATSWKHKLINVGNGWIANKKLGWQHFWPEIVAFVISHPKIATKHVSWNRIHCISRHCCCDSTGWCWINPGASRKSTLPRRALCLECPIAGTHGTCRGKVPRTSGRQNWWMRSLSKICNGSTQTQISAALDLPCCMTVAENKPTNEPKCVT